MATSPEHAIPVPPRRVPNVADSLPMVVAVALALAVAYVAARLLGHGDITRFVRAGPGTSNAALTPSVLHVREGIGYDGQFFFRLALDPLTNVVQNYGIRLDNPPYRHQRIGYPLLAWGLALGGRPLAVAWALVAINVVALAGVGAAGAALARSIGRPAIAGLFFVANPAFWVALAFDTPEIVSGLAVLIALVLLRRDRYRAAAAVLVVAVFVRETALLLPIGLALARLVRLALDRKRAATGAPPAYVWIVPAIAYVAWQGLLAIWWGTLGVTSGADKNITLPFIGIAELAGDMMSASGDADPLDGLMALLLVAVVALGVYALVHGAGALYERCAFVAGAALLAVSASPVWFSYASFVRTSAQVITFATLLVLADRASNLRLLLVVPTATALVIAFTVGL